MNQKEQVLRELITRQLEKNNENCRSNFKDFCQKMFRGERGESFLWNWHLDEITDNLNSLMAGDFELLIVNIPPRHFKTETITKLYPVWLLGKNPSMEIISTGYSASLTQTFSGEARDYYSSDTFRMIFPRRPEIRRDQNSREFWKNDDGGSYFATGVGGSITGKGADLFIIDDPINPNDTISSNLAFDRVKDWFANTAKSRLNSRNNENGEIISNGKMVIVMQRLHDDDLCGYLLRHFSQKFKEGKYRVISFPAIATEDEPHRKMGEALFPQKYPLPWLLEQRTAMTTECGANHFSAQYQQNPIDVEAAEFKREYFRYYRDTDTIKFTKTIISVDPAISEKQTADNSAISVVSQDEDGRFYRRASFAGRVGSHELIDTIFAFQGAFSCSVVIEALGFQKVLANNIRDEMVRRSQFFNLIEIGSRGEKNARIRATLGALYPSFQIFHREDDKFSPFEDELLRFPRGVHDDEIDAFETAISQIRQYGIDKNEKVQKIDNEYKKIENNIRNLYIGNGRK